jgi:DNA-binding NarL/FixJ family response regulator
MFFGQGVLCKHLGREGPFICNPHTMTPSFPIKVALVEDRLDVSETWQALIDSCEGLACVCCCASGEEALRQLPQFGPAVVLMDILLPGMSGIECTARLKSLMPQTQILILTASFEGDVVFRALEAGADGYLLKGTAREALRNAVIDVVSGGAPMSGEIARRVVTSFRKSGLGLTSREQEVLALLAKGAANKEIAAALAVSPETVHAHLKRIYEKLHVHSRREAAERYLSFNVLAACTPSPPPSPS